MLKTITTTIFIVTSFPLCTANPFSKKVKQWRQANEMNIISDYPAIYFNSKC
jgi:hypothetical protein